MTPKHIAYIRPYSKDGRTRIWLEGRRLSDIGFNPGDRFAIHYSENAIEIKLTDGIGKKVHGKRKNGGTWPIVDIFNVAVDTAIRGAQRLRAEFTMGTIRISVAGVSKAAAARLQQLLKSVAGRALTAGSLFHGLGVLDHALHQGLKESGQSVELSFAIEHDSSGLDASLANNPVWQDGGAAILGNIDDVDVELLPHVDILCAGIPCQGASMQGRTSLRLKSPEHHPDVGHLFVPYLRVVRATNPGICVIENVPEYASSVSLAVLRKEFENLGYAFELTELAGNDFGALEGRRRMVAIARPNHMPSIVERLQLSPNAEQKLGDILEAIAEDDILWRDYAHVHDKVARDALKPGNGFKLTLLDEETKVVPTIIKGYETTKSWQPFIRHPSNPELMRKLTPVEHARVKGIPSELIAGLPPTVAHKLLGQSIIHPVFTAVGRAIGEAIRAFQQARPGAGHPSATPDLFLTAA